MEMAFVAGLVLLGTAFAVWAVGYWLVRWLIAVDQGS